MKRIALITLATILLLLPALAINCGSSGEDSKAIEDTIRGFVSSYNDSDFDKCMDYFTGFSEQEKIGLTASLTSDRTTLGKIILTSIGKITIDGSTATAEVSSTQNTESSTDSLYLSKTDGKWKIDVSVGN